MKNKQEDYKREKRHLRLIQTKDLIVFIALTLIAFFIFIFILGAFIYSLK